MTISLCLYLTLSISFYISIYLFIYIYIYLFIYLSVYLSICISIYLSFFLFIYLSLISTLFLSQYLCLSCRLIFSQTPIGMPILSLFYILALLYEQWESFYTVNLSRQGHAYGQSTMDGIHQTEYKTCS